MNRLLHLSITILALSTYSYSETELDIYSGFARVSDGDTLRIDKTTFRLHGIDAPERFQTCLDEDNQTYNCGKVATTVLRKWTFEKQVECIGTERDRYNRIIGVCYLDGIDLNAALVRRGLVVAS